MILNNTLSLTNVEPMKTTAITFATIASLSLAAPASAACFADYKAKQDDPLKLHYGVAEIAGDCTPENAAAQLTSRLEDGGWVLLNVLSVFDSSGLQERQDDAGQFYLRY